MVPSGKNRPTKELIYNLKNIINLDEKRPHVNVTTTEGNVHVIPVSVIENIIDGDLDITELDDWKLIMKRILNEWLLTCRNGS